MNLVLKDKKGIGFRFAWNGIIEIIRSEQNMKIHVLSAITVILMGIYFRLSFMEWTVVVIVIGFVLTAEMINTSIEKLIDYLNPEIHPTAKVIKDISAGAVLVAATTAVAVGLFIFIPKILMW